MEGRKVWKVLSVHCWWWWWRWNIIINHWWYCLLLRSRINPDRLKRCLHLCISYRERMECLTIICNTILYSKQLAKSNTGTALNINLLWNHTIYKTRFNSHYNRTWPIPDAKLPWLFDNLLWHPEFHTHFFTKQLHSLPLTKSPPWKSVSCDVNLHGQSSNQPCCDQHRKQQDWRGFAVPGIFQVNFFVF